ncbi:phenylalanine--tRNA ligase subunit alpha [Borreliella turdi]|uniref:phenylalanine--tRNA ligase subunit alpha n=1 Tax=Borreliella turdi TaxID=57863 RepID=UPI0026487C1D|nr:phenylalanine--tRNA ligase subunit alpha [Borreliella turdi]WKC78063.1 phenylalanine--tRNA ligase subunit alpha [Borreliella turdi]
MKADLNLIKTLHPLEIKVILNNQEKDDISASIIIEKLGFNEGQANKTIEWLNSKRIIEEIHRKLNVFYKATERGLNVLRDGFVEEKIINLVSKNAVLVSDLALELDLDAKEVKKAFGNLLKEGILSLDLNKKIIINCLYDGIEANYQKIRVLLERAKSSNLIRESLTTEELLLISNFAKKKGSDSVFFKIIEKLDLKFRLSSFGLEVKNFLIKSRLTGDELTKLTPEILKNKTYENKEFRAYNIHTPSAKTFIGRFNSYLDYISKIKDKLVGLGFEEFDGPLVETEFFNNDALFMPQFHPSRDIKDVYYISDPSMQKSLPEPYFSNVKLAHETGHTTGSRGWRYSFNEDLSKRLVLRTQGTVLSAKQLINAKNPSRYFGVIRCFRYDQVDATHGVDFYQTEGIVIEDNVSIKTLLGLLEIFAKEFAGATEVKYVPAYFPFTEPSIEMHVKHPVLGWFELGGSGIFRPEVTKPLGIDIPVIAWGIGIDRMALMQLGLNDLRDLFTYDISDVVLRRGNIRCQR